MRAPKWVLPSGAREPKAGQELDTRQIAACLDYTTATASDAMDDEPRGPKAAS